MTPDDARAVLQRFVCESDGIAAEAAGVLLAEPRGYEDPIEIEENWRVRALAAEARFEQACALALKAANDAVEFSPACGDRHLPRLTHRLDKLRAEGKKT